MASAMLIAKFLVLALGLIFCSATIAVLIIDGIDWLWSQLF